MGVVGVVGVAVHQGGALVPVVGDHGDQDTAHCRHMSHHGAGLGTVLCCTAAAGRMVHCGHQVAAGPRLPPSRPPARPARPPPPRRAATPLIGRPPPVATNHSAAWRAGNHAGTVLHTIFIYEEITPVYHYCN